MKPLASLINFLSFQCSALERAKDRLGLSLMCPRPSWSLKRGRQSLQEGHSRAEPGNEKKGWSHCPMVL